MSRVPEPHHLSFWRRPLWWAVLAISLALGATGVGVAQELPGFPGFGLGGSAPAGMMTPQDAWLFDVSPLSLMDIDPLSGAMLGHADIPDGFDHAATQALMDTNQMAFDAARLAAQIRAELEKKRAEALAKGIAVKPIRDLGYPEEWELDNFSDCGAPDNSRYRARIEVVAAWEIMCRDAEADGVKLGIVSAYRSIEHQTRLWNERVAKELKAGYSQSEAEARARKWVAPPGRSQHNRGLAIDTNVMTGASNVRTWMHTKVGCFSPPDNLRMGTSITCTSNESVVKRIQLYGFVLPMDYEPWHIELGIRIDAGPTAKTTACNPGGGLNVPEMIGAIFRCRLDEAGLSGDAERVTAEAVMVAQCESGWKPTAFIYGGRYAEVRNPADGKFYTARGVFQFIRVSGNNWIEGGWENADDPVANIDAAARYYIYERKQGREGWGPWACRTVLPQYGGKAIPTWAYQY